MGFWKKTDCAKYGVAVSRFRSSNPRCLSLDLGEAVLIYEQTEGSEWYRGCSLVNRNVKGVFPASYVNVRDWSIETKRCEVEAVEFDVTTSKELSVILELTSVLREWGTIWKQLFVKNDDRRFRVVRKIIIDLMNWRRQVMSGALTGDQLKQVKLEIANKIDYGNKYLGLDLVVRDSEGNVIDVDTTGVIELYKRHMESLQRSEQPLLSRKARSIQAQSLMQYASHNLYISVKNLAFKFGDDAEVFITLYDGRIGAFISEHFFILWDKPGMPKDLEKLHNMSCLYTDLGSQDLQRDKLFIVCQIIRDGRMDIKDNDSKKFTTRLRRPYGVAVLHVSDIMQGKYEEDEDREYFLQLQSIASDEYLDTAIKKIVQKSPSSAQSSSSGSGQGIWLTVRMLNGDLAQVKEEHPLLITPFTTVARKQGFPDVIMPGDIRNDMYLSIMSGSFERGNKSANKNIQVSVGVYDADGKPMQNVVCPGAGENHVNEYYSTVYYHSATPRWMEVVKLSLPIEKVKIGSHIRFVFRHRATYDEKDKSQKIFALAYVNFLNDDGTCLQDGTHELAVYKCELRKIDDCQLYLKLPSLKSEILPLLASKKHVNSAGLSYSKNESFIVGFQLCSTKLAQNVDLLGLLKWRSDKSMLAKTLPALMNVGGQEIVKFLQDTFDALFAILMDNAVAYGEKVADAVVFCIGLLADKKYHRFRSILDAYITNLFSSTKAHITLTEVLQKNIELALQPDLSAEAREHVIKYYKALEYLVKFIVRSRSLSERCRPRTQTNPSTK